MDNNPYVSPTSELHLQHQARSSSEVSHELIDLLARTKPWLRVVGVFMWIGGAFGGDALNAGSAQWNSPMMLGLAMFYVVAALAYIYPARRIWSSGSAIGRLVQSHRLADLRLVLEAQRSFWKFLGISFLALAG